LTEERFRLEAKVESSLVDQDVRSVDLYSEGTSGVLVLLVMQPKIELEIVLVGEYQFVLDGKIFRIIAVDDREATPLENYSKYNLGQSLLLTGTEEGMTYRYLELEHTSRAGETARQREQD
jgi:hypothetical protein